MRDYADPTAWVRHVAWNLAKSRLRRRQTVAKFLLRQRVEHVPEPSLDGVALQAALATLPVRHRRAVVQFYIGRLTTAEIAMEEGVAESTVPQRSVRLAPRRGGQSNWVLVMP